MVKLIAFSFELELQNGKTKYSVISMFATISGNNKDMFNSYKYELFIYLFHLIDDKFY